MKANLLLVFILFSFILFCWACDDVNRISLTPLTLELLRCFLFFDPCAEIAEDAEDSCIRTSKTSASFVESFSSFLANDDDTAGFVLCDNVELVDSDTLDGTNIFSFCRLF